MDLHWLIQRLEQQAEVIRRLATGVSAEEARWRPAEDAWSLVEVVAHLCDEEREDFRPRLDITLSRPEEPFPPIAPDVWVTARAYRTRELNQVLEEFLRERVKSVAWLRGLGAPDWQAAHPTSWGNIRAGDLLAAWVAHDLHHIRQMTEWHHARLAHRVRPYTTRYAGEW